ncbi:MAG TPA: glycosyltransferase family 39 protein [Thermoanaerobaculia bacterium]|nr:glycosyltransferase family 39 protein [Thermoanaerobaculia bacterium]
MSPRRRDLLALAALAALLYLPGLGARDLWNPDEARYAQVAREMLERRDPLVPHLNGEVYTQKPPLLFWAIGAVSLSTGGVGETSARLPSALAAIAATLLVFRLGERLFGRRAAWLAAAVFATCAKVLWQGRFGQIDMLLVALVTLAVWWWARGWTEGRRGFYLLFFLAAGLATLAKGPVGLLPPLLSILAFLALTGQWGEVRRLGLGRGLLLWAAIVAAWLVPAALAAGPVYLDEVLFKQNLTRYADPWHHLQPWHYYLTVLPADFFPWSFLLPAALVVGRREGWLRRRERHPFLFALCWVAVTLLFFSLSSAKRTVYVLTLYPALALLVGAALDRAAAAWPRDRRWITGTLAALAALCPLLVAALPLVAGRRAPEVAVLGGEALVLKAGAALALLAAGAAAAWWWTLRGRPLQATASLAGGTAAMALAAFLLVVPAFDAVKSARPLSRVLTARLAPGEVYGIYPHLNSTFLFYGRRRAVPLESEAALRRFAARPGRVWLLVRRHDLAWLRRGGPLPLVEVAREADPRKGYLLLTRPPRVGSVR